jgi:MFS transporter, MHS family, proline/betaine transporter
MAAPSLGRLTTATVIGNALEWYDFTVYGAFAVTLSALFFPAHSGATAILSTLAIFGVAYIVRPLGGLIFGHYADLIGRKNILLIMIALMTFGMALLAFAPTYATVGIAAPVILLAARMIQGFSAGGEFATGTTFLVEHAPPNHRGLFGAWQFTSQGISVMLGGIVGSLVTRGLSHEALMSWGWRIPFLLGLVIGPIGFYMRRNLEETPEFVSERGAGLAAQMSPTIGAFASYKLRMFWAFLMTLGGTASFYVLYIVMPTYAIRTLHLGVAASLVAPLVGGAASLTGAPIGGILADRFGRKPPMLITVGLLVILVLPAFAWLAADPSVGRMAQLEFVLSLLLGAYGGSAATAMADLFPVGVRATGLTISYNVGVGVFGGFAPLVVTWLVEVTGSPLAPAYYDLAGLVLALIAILALPRPYDQRLWSMSTVAAESALAPSSSERSST